MAAWADAARRPGARGRDGRDPDRRRASGCGGCCGASPPGRWWSIDYGDTGPGLAPRRAEGTLRTYRRHHLGPDPLLEPGGTDITVDVDFGALAAVAEEEGAAVEVLSQAAFLERWGLRDVLAAGAPRNSPWLATATRSSGCGCAA